MITIDEKDFYQSIKKAYSAIDAAPKSADPDIYTEDTAIFSFNVGYEDPRLVQVIDSRLECRFDRSLYFPYNSSLKVEAENIYWSEKLIDEDYINKAVSHLRNTPLSRSCLYNFWDNEDFDDANPKGNCITQIYLRLRDGALEMHSHIRANDVHRCLFMDLAFLMYAHTTIAGKLGLSKGAFIHFVDSLHIYNKSLDEFEKQRDFMLDTTSPWNI